MNIRSFHKISKLKEQGVSLYFGAFFCIIVAQIQRLFVKKSLIALSDTELKDIFYSLGEKNYRVEQLRKAIYEDRFGEIDEITTFSKSLREKLKSEFSIHSLELADLSHYDDTIKFLFRLADKQLIESVLMPSEDRLTLCISSQVGCAVDCKFCATGKMGFKRNLSSAEIIEQVLYLSRYAKKRVTNVVFMGMGEPFLNYDAVIEAAKQLNDPKYFGISTRKITISTSGIIPQIYQYSDEGQPYRLAISLNDANQKRREASMPISKKYTVEALLEAAQYYTRKSEKRITFEYVMIKNQNIAYEDAKLLRNLLHPIDCKLNLIPCNSKDDHFLRPSNEEAEQFKQWIEQSKPTFIRKTRGRSIDAACGMLHNKFLNQKHSLGAVS